MRTLRLARASSAIMGTCLLVACGGTTNDGSGTETGAFIAFTPDFFPFRTWEAFDLPDSGAQGSVHLAGPKTCYLKERPPPASTQFPVGTIIVKEFDVGSYESRQVFAMVKRGGGYDAAGAVGWEWFELENNPDGSVGRIVWRGLGPPAGEMYGGDPTGCSGCHGAKKDNDYVQSVPLQLSNF